MTKAKKNAAEANEAKATKCPITREQFQKAPTGIAVRLHDGTKEVGALVAMRKDDFASGSVGWYAGEKIVVEIDGVPTKVQVGLNMTVVGSKGLPK